jgi:uncharacterized protein (TIGR02646 family)
MISLTKIDCPQVLLDNAENWRDELMAVIASGEEATRTQKNRYNHRDIKDAVISETSGKCAYCESKIRHVDDGDIEHIDPKAPHPEKSFEWNNLTLACTICNRLKDDYTVTAATPEALINPYIDHPNDHFLFHKEILTPVPESLRAHKTEEQIKLNRNALIEKRREQISEIHDYLTTYAQATVKYRPFVLRQMKKRWIGGDKEYSAFIKSYFDQMIARGTIPADIYD